MWFSDTTWHEEVWGKICSMSKVTKLLMIFLCSLFKISGNFLKTGKWNINVIIMHRLFTISWFMEISWKITTLKIGAPRKWRRGLKIWTPSFSDCLVLIEPRTAPKSNLAWLAYEKCLLDIPHRTKNKDHLSIKSTFLDSLGSNLHVNEPVYRDHLLLKTTFPVSLGWSL